MALIVAAEECREFEDHNRNFTSPHSHLVRTEEAFGLWMTILVFPYYLLRDSNSRFGEERILHLEKQGTSGRTLPLDQIFVFRYRVGLRGSERRNWGKSIRRSYRRLQPRVLDRSIKCRAHGEPDPANTKYEGRPPLATSLGTATP